MEPTFAFTDSHWFNAVKRGYGFSTFSQHSCMVNSHWMERADEKGMNDIF
ncbi:MAG: hypothetical protein CM1200mP1_12410 [Candidatus Neomarinimicrobiota bacterium]|nr:MAG: hypothetical protein CM1200mP1_12410 [Candidatus Neomarinimicrobiota bacterium]